MKTAEITIDGIKYLAVFNNAVLTQLEDNGLSLRDLKEKKPVSNIALMMSLMIQQGAKYAEYKGLGTYPTINAEQFAFLTDYGDFADYQQLIADLIAGDRRVDAEPEKKDEAAAEAALIN